MRNRQNRIKLTTGEIVFNIFNYTIFALFALICIFPFYYVIINSLSDNANSGNALFWPVGFHLDNWEQVFTVKGLVHSFGVSVLRVVVGTVLSLLCTSFMGYALSRRELFARRVWYRMITFTMYFGAGMIATYLVYVNYGLRNTFWVYILPGLISPYNLMLFKTYVESIPESLEESAQIDGAGYLTRFIMIVLPLCKPIIGTLCIFTAVGHWNAFMDCIMYITDERLFTAMFKLRQVLSEAQQIAQQIINGGAAADVDFSQMTATGLRFTIAAVVTLPVLCIYPFFQKYFTGGIMIGAVKG